MKSEMKMPRDRDREVKFPKKISRILEKQDSRRLLTHGHIGDKGTDQAFD